MDVTSSAITIVSSVWTLSVRCQQLIGGVGALDNRLKGLDRKAKSFATVVEHIRDAYSPDEQGGEDLYETNPREKQIREEVCKKLAVCEEDLKEFEKQVAELVRQRKKGRYGAGLVLASWREKVAGPTFTRIEDSIETHQQALQALMAYHQGRRMEQTNKSLQQIHATLEQMFDKIDELVQSQTTSSNEQQTLGLGLGINNLQRRTSEATISNDLEDPDASVEPFEETDNSAPLHQVAQGLLQTLMGSVARRKASMSGPTDRGSSPNLPDAGDWTAFVDTFLRQGFNPNPTTPTNALKKVRTYSTSDKRPSKLSFSIPAETKASFDSPHAPGSVSPEARRFAIEHLTSLARTGTTSSDYAVTEGSSENADSNAAPGRPLAESLQSRTDTEKGRQLLEVIRSCSHEALGTLLNSEASLEERDEKGKTPLILAASLGKDDVASRLLDHGASARAVDQDGATALHFAYRGNFPSVATILLKRRDAPLQVNLADKRGRTPLHYCTYYNPPEEAMLHGARNLLACGADRNARDGSEKAKEDYRFPPIYYAIKNRKYGVVRFFLTEPGVPIDLNFRRPDTSPEINQLLNDHLSGKSLASPTSPSASSSPLGAGSATGGTDKASRKQIPSRKDSLRSEKEPKARRLSSFGRKWSGTKT